MSEPIEPEEDPPRVKIRRAQLTPALRDADIWAEQVVRERLPRTRELAQQWGATVTALTSLLGAGTIISSDDVVRSLDPPAWSMLYGVLVGFSLVSAAVSILLASLAGQASWAVIRPGVRERLALYEELVTRARNQLWWSRVLAAISLVLLIISFAVRWFAPVMPAPATSSAVYVGTRSYDHAVIVVTRSEEPTSLLTTQIHSRCNV